MSLPEYKSHPDKPDLTQGAKLDQGKARWDLMSPYALEAIADVVTFGSVKYDDRNWEKGIKYGRLFAATMRHLWGFWRHKDYDPESALHSLAHAGCDIMFLLHYVITGQYVEYDDRAPAILTAPSLIITGELYPANKTFTVPLENTQPDSWPVTEPDGGTGGKS